jgi:hypothetical protein
VLAAMEKGRTGHGKKKAENEAEQESGSIN